MTISFHARGATSSVFDMGDGSVVKAYHRGPATHPPTTTAQTDYDAISRTLWAHEVAAHERLARHPTLSGYVPRFLGRVDPATLIPKEVIKYELIPGCGARMEKIEGNATKILRLAEPKNTEVKALMERFERELPNCEVWDASAFEVADRNGIVIIDFAFWHGIHLYRRSLEEVGELSPMQRGNLEAVCANPSP